MSRYETKRRHDGSKDVLWVMDAVDRPTHRTIMDAAEFKPLLTRKEFKAFRNSTVTIVADTFYLLTNRNGVVDTASQIFKDVMDAAVSAGDLTQTRANELALGIPI